MSNKEKIIKHFETDLKKDVAVIEYLMIKVNEAQAELDRARRKAKKTQMTIEELQIGKK